MAVLKDLPASARNRDVIDLTNSGMEMPNGLLKCLTAKLAGLAVTKLEADFEYDEKHILRMEKIPASKTWLRSSMNPRRAAVIYALLGEAYEAATLHPDWADG